MRTERGERVESERNTVGKNVGRERVSYPQVSKERRIRVWDTEKMINSMVQNNMGAKSVEGFVMQKGTEGVLGTWELESTYVERVVVPQSMTLPKMYVVPKMTLPRCGRLTFVGRQGWELFTCGVEKLADVVHVEKHNKNLMRAG